MGWRRYFRRKWWDAERAREIESYLEIETAENIARGVNPSDAAAAARRKFGNPEFIREEIYLMNTAGWFASIWQDLRFGARQLRQSPAFALVAIGSLALGIGANTAIFQLLDAVRLRSLPVPNPEQLAEVRIAGGNGGLGLNQRYGELTRPLWQQLRSGRKSFSGMFAWSHGDARIGPATDLRRAQGLWVSGEFFPVLGVLPWRGRLLLPEDERPCPSLTAVVSYGYWLSEMGAREIGPDAALLVNGELLHVVGVTPPGFFGLAVGESFDFAAAFCQPRQPFRADIFDISVMGRLRPGVTLTAASAELAAISPASMAATLPTGFDSRTVEKYKRFRLTARTASAGVSSLRGDYDTSLRLLLGITGLVLLIAGANLANLMLARANARQREVAVRLALGASRWRIVRQMLAESVLIGVTGAAAGIVLAQSLSRLLVWSLGTQDSKVHLDVALDWRVLLFTMSVGACTCLLFGVVPALRATNADPVSAMKTGGRGMTAGRERYSVQRLLVVTQVSISLVLLVSALLFVRSFRNLLTIDPGMREEGITVAFAGFHKSNIPVASWADFRNRLMEEVRAAPGIEDAATTTIVPLLGSAWGHGVRVGTVEDFSMFTGVSNNYFETMGIPLLAGRRFGREDTASSTPVAIVNQAYIRRFLAGQDPVGKTMRSSPEPNYPATVYQIVGVSRDTKYSDIRSATPAMTFVPAAQYPAPVPWTTIMIRSRSHSAAVAAVRKRMTAEHPEIQVEFMDFQQNVRDRLVRERLMALLAGFFGVLAALLAAVGLYGVVSYMTARRRNEIGVRMALGARRAQVVRMVLREAAIMVVIGMTVGTALSLLAGRTAKSLLFELQPWDPLTIGTAIGALTMIAILASLLPARRAAKLDPMAALRYE